MTNTQTSKQLQGAIYRDCTSVYERVLWYWACSCTRVELAYNMNEFFVYYAAIPDNYVHGNSMYWYWIEWLTVVNSDGCCLLWLTIAVCSAHTCTHMHTHVHARTRTPFTMATVISAGADLQHTNLCLHIYYMPTRTTTSHMCAMTLCNRVHRPTSRDTSTMSSISSSTSSGFH